MKFGSIGRIAGVLAFGAAIALGGVSQAAELIHLKVGVRGGIDEQLWEVATRGGKTNGLDIEIVPLAGTISPNEALNSGDLQANSFQHIPFFKDQLKARGYKLVLVGHTYLSPCAFYSKKYKSLSDLPNGAEIGVPDDPSNQTRALVILRDYGVIRLKDGFDPFTGTASLADIVENPRNLKFVEAKNVVLARSWQDVDAAAVISSFASQAGLNAARDGIVQEKLEKNPYVNIIAVREQDKDAPWVALLVKSFQSDEVRRFIESEFKGVLVPAF